MESILVALLVGGFLAMMLPVAIVPLLVTDVAAPETEAQPARLAVLGRHEEGAEEERMAA